MVLLFVYNIIPNVIAIIFMSYLISRAYQFMIYCCNSYLCRELSLCIAYDNAESQTDIFIYY